MNRHSTLIAIALYALFLPTSFVRISAQERITPKQSRGGKELREQWSTLPAQYRQMQFPEWPLPTRLEKWKQTERKKTRAIVERCLGEMRARPRKLKVTIVAREEHPEYRLERFQFHNGVDAVVPGILLIPKSHKGPRPTIIGLHGHGGSSKTICTDLNNPQCVGPMLAKKGFVVAAIDTYFCGARSSRSKTSQRGLDEGTLARLNLVLGRTLWGMMIRDQQILVDYLHTRKEVNVDRIGVTGMSMGRNV